ncbi:hypothetical protein BT69DRAFT_1329360 [Atractiella rhizophila]|nr:hypothetical protein BT69DRAFT_1329360 [Atractiella rhizophila]
MEAMVGSLREEVDRIFTEERVSASWDRYEVQSSRGEGGGIDSQGWIWPDGIGEEVLYYPPFLEPSMLSADDLSLSAPQQLSTSQRSRLPRSLSGPNSRL